MDFGVRLRNSSTMLFSRPLAHIAVTQRYIKVPDAALLGRANSLEMRAAMMRVEWGCASMAARLRQSHGVRVRTPTVSSAGIGSSLQLSNPHCRMLTEVFPSVPSFEHTRIPLSASIGMDGSGPLWPALYAVQYNFPVPIAGDSTRHITTQEKHPKGADIPPI